MFATPCGGLPPPTSRPVAVVRAARSIAAAPSCQSDFADQTTRCGYSSSIIARYCAKTGLVTGMSASAAFTSPPDLMRRRAIAIATFSLPWKYLFAVSDDIAIFTRGSQSTSSVHSQRRLPSSSSRAARMLATRSRSSNSYRIGTSASRSLGPMSGSSFIIENTRSITSLNSLGESKEAAIGYEPDVVPPAPEDVEPPAEVVPPERVERRVAGLRADVARDADPPDDEADRDDEDRDDGV